MSKFEKTVFYAASLLLVTIVLSICLLSLVPPVSRDALVHHLAVPKLYLTHGKMMELPCMPYSYFPMNLGLIYMGALALGSDIAPKFIHGFFGLTTAFLIYTYLRQKINRAYGMLGAVLFLSLPIVIKLSITAYVDLGLVCFSTASLLMMLKWMDKGFRLRYLVWSGVWCGLALGTKYNGLVAFFLLAMFVPLACAGSFESRKVFNRGKYFLIFILISLAVYSPWMVRNYAWTGNPLYPFYNRYFPTKASSCLPVFLEQYREQGASIDVFTYRALMYGEAWWEIALLPVRIFFQGKDNDFKHFDGQLSGLLFFLPMLACLRPRNGPEGGGCPHWKYLISFSVLFFLFTLFSTTMRIRYILPAVPPLVILSAFGLKNCADYIIFGGPGFKRLGIAFLVSASALYHLFFSCGPYIAEQFHTIRPLAFITGKVTRDQYISMFRKEYPVLNYINMNLPEKAKILSFYMGKRGYYIDRDYIPDPAGNLTIIFGMIRAGMVPEQIFNAFKSTGITNLLMHYASVNGMIRDKLTDWDRAVFAVFMKNYTTQLYTQNGYGLHALH